MPHRDKRDLLGSETFEIGLPDDFRGEGRREPRKLQSIVRKALEEAQDWRDENLDADQTKATEYYKQEPFGDEREGRSQVVSPDVRDAVRAAMPGIMRTFFGSERVVEFKPKGPEDVEIAKQQTEYVNYIFTEDNEGFMEAHAAFKDAMVRKLGIVKCWWEDRTEVDGGEYTGLPAEAVNILAAEDEVEFEEVLQVQDEDPEEGVPALFDVKIRRVRRDGRVKVEAVPPEEFLWSPSAKSLEDARMVAHVRELRADELIAMGVDEETVRKHRGRERERNENELRNVRRADEGAFGWTEDDQPDETRPVRFADVWMHVDEDGDGIAELRHIQAIGASAEIIHNEIATHKPFALFGVDPEPHTIVGLSLADLVMDLQRIRSYVQRGMLDSLAQSLNPITEVVRGKVEIGDLMDPEIGQIVRVDAPGQMREVTTPFVGADALPVLAYLDEQKTERTGISKAAEGLDPDALQSSTKAAVSATIKAAQSQIELIARLFAETGMKQLFKGILRETVQHQDFSRVVRLRNEFVRVDPREWDADKDVAVNVALGTGLTEEKIQMLSVILEKQEQLLAAGAPLVGFSEYRSTLARLVELVGFKNPDEFFKPFGPQEEQALQQAKAQQPKEPTDNEVVMQVEMAKIKARNAEKLADLRMRMAELQLEREKITRELALDEAELELKAEQAAVDSAIEEARVQIERQTKLVDNLSTMSQTQVGSDE